MSSSSARSTAALQYRRWYYTGRWRRLRAAQLSSDPYCWLCAAAGRQTRATIVDHHKPHRGDAAMFFDPGNLTSLCAPHHDATKQRAERGRAQIAVDADGWPVEIKRGG